MARRANTRGGLALAAAMLVGVCACGRAPESSATAAPAPVMPAGAIDDRADAGPAIAPCGDDGASRCPLREWMSSVLAPARRRGDAPAEARALLALRGAGPAEFGAWSALAERGAVAVARGDEEGTQTACAECHERFRNEYRRRFRHRALPAPLDEGGGE